jgi:hypothetical protein
LAGACQGFGAEGGRGSGIFNHNISIADVSLQRTAKAANTQSHSVMRPGDEARRSIPLHRRKPVPTAEVDPGFRRESEEGRLLKDLNGSED